MPIQKINFPYPDELVISNLNVTSGLAVTGGLDIVGMIQFDKIAPTVAGVMYANDNGNFSSTDAGNAGQLLMSYGSKLSNGGPQWVSFQLKEQVIAATTTNQVGTYVVGTGIPDEDGTADTFTYTATGEISIDDQPITTDQRVLFKDQTDARQNGVWIVVTQGAGGIPMVLTRDNDADTGAKLAVAIIPVDTGTVNGGTLWFSNNKATDITGTSSFNYYQIMDTNSISVLTNKTKRITSNLSTFLQPSIGHRPSSGWIPGAGSATAPGIWGFPTFTASASNATARIPSVGSALTRAKRIGYISNSATAGTVPSLRLPTAMFTVGDGTGLGGFYSVQRFAPCTDAVSISAITNTVQSSVAITAITAGTPVSAVAITAIASTGTTVTYSTATTTGITVGQQITIAGATTTAFNGTFTVSAFTGSTSITVLSTATGATSTANYSYSTVVYSTATTTGVVVGQPITIAGATTTAFNGNYTVVALTAGTSITVSSTATGTTSTATYSANFSTFSTTTPPYLGSLVTIAGATSAVYNTLFTVYGVTATTNFIVNQTLAGSNSTAVWSMTNGARGFYGLSSSTSSATNVEPSTLINSIGVGHGASDRYLSLYYGGSAAQTPISLGSSFPVDPNNYYELTLYNASTSTNSISYIVTNLVTKVTAIGTLKAATVGTQLPNQNTLLGMQMWRSNNLTAVTIAFDIMSLYVDTDL
jgi:hypothetical protein